MDDTTVTEKRGWLATGGLIGAALVSSCCILPFVLVTLGVSGAWIGNLTALAPYQAIFWIPTVAFLGAGFWAVYFRAKPECATDSYRASSTSDRIVRVTLWVATTLVLAAGAVNFAGPLFI